MKHAEKLMKQTTEVMNAIMMKLPERENKEVKEEDKEMSDQIKLVWDKIQDNLMRHFKTFSTRGERLVHSTTTSYKLVELTSKRTFENENMAFVFHTIL